VGYCGYHAADVTRPFAERQARGPASPITIGAGGRETRGGGRLRAYHGGDKNRQRIRLPLAWNPSVINRPPPHIWRLVYFFR